MAEEGSWTRGRARWPWTFAVVAATAVLMGTGAAAAHGPRAHPPVRPRLTAGGACVVYPRPRSAGHGRTSRRRAAAHTGKGGGTAKTGTGRRHRRHLGPLGQGLAKVRLLGGCIREDMARADGAFQRLGPTLGGLLKGGLTARQRLAQRLRTESLGPQVDLTAAGSGARQVEHLAHRLLKLNFHDARISQERAARVVMDLHRVVGLSRQVGASAVLLNAMARVARLLEANRARLMLGQSLPAPVLRQVAASLAVAVQAERGVGGTAFAAAERAYVQLTVAGLKALVHGMPPVEALAFEQKGKMLRSRVAEALPGYVKETAVHLAALAKDGATAGGLLTRIRPPMARHSHPHRHGV